MLEIQPDDPKDMHPDDVQRFLAAGLPGRPPCSRTLGLEVISIDLRAGTSHVRYEAKPEFCNPAGVIQGGFAAAMLDDAIGMLTTLKLAGKAIPSTIELGLQYLRPVRPGMVEVRAQILSLGRSMIFAEAELYDPRGKKAVLARSSLTVIKLPANKRPADSDTPEN